MHTRTQRVRNAHAHRAIRSTIASFAPYSDDLLQLSINKFALAGTWNAKSSLQYKEKKNESGERERENCIDKIADTRPSPPWWFHRAPIRYRLIIDQWKDLTDVGLRFRLHEKLRDGAYPIVVIVHLRWTASDVNSAPIIGRFIWNWT